MLFEEDTLTIPPVRNFNLERYLGRWYEIARLPHHFERGTESVYADYFLQEEELLIRNCGVRDGKEYETIGRAKLDGEKNTGAFKVHFFGPWYMDLDYRIVFLDSEYRYAIVGTPNRNHLWFLARRSILSMAHLKVLREFAGFHGFDISLLEYPQQPNASRNFK